MMDGTVDVFVADLRRPLVAALAVYVGDRLVAEDIAQEALARAVLRWGEVSAKDNPRAWVYRVAFNLARSRFRRLAAERRALSRRPPQPDVAGPEQATPTALAVRNAVDGLPKRYRQVVACRFLADLSVADTAVVMGCAEGTVKSLTSKALGALRDAGLEEVALDA